MNVLAALAAAALLGVASPSSRSVVAGPVFSSDRVLWGEVRGQANVLVGAGDAAPLWQSRSAWLAGPLAASASTVAFAASSTGCSGSNVACPVETTVYAGKLGESWRAVRPRVRCVSTAAGRTVAVSGPLVATVTPNCSADTATVSVRAGRREWFRRTGADCCEVALAGKLLAWQSGGAVNVFDLATRRLRFRATAPAGEPIAAFDVQADGKLAMLIGHQPDGHSTVAWRSAADPTLHHLPLRAIIATRQPSLRLIGDRLVLKTAPPATASDRLRRSSLVVSDLAGRARVLARFAARVEQVGGFDANAHTVTWASRRITRSRLDCPPAAVGPACLLKKTGLLTIWRAQIGGGRADAVTSWPFTNAP